MRIYLFFPILGAIYKFYREIFLSNQSESERERENIWKAICCCTDIIPYFDFDELLQITRLFSDKFFFVHARVILLSFPFQTEVSRTTKAKENEKM